jgi:hypothetical protein
LRPVEGVEHRSACHFFEELEGYRAKTAQPAIAGGAE